MNILLKNVYRYSKDGEGRQDIRITKSRIETIGRGLLPRRDERVLDLTAHTALPGLINGHDHLSLNLFPRRGRPPYANFYEWGRDVYRPDDSVQREITALPLRERLLWGGYKNLIGGSTTVAHHDPYVPAVFNRRFPVDVLRRYEWAHSLGYGRHVGWKGRWAKIRRRPFIIHAAEGVDEGSAHEIDRLLSMGMLGASTVLVHAVALTPRHVDVLAETGCSVITCPSSSEFLYGASAPVSRLKRRNVPVALGTDSTLSGSPTLLHEIRYAHEIGMATAEHLFELVTNDAARIFQLTDGRGTIREGGRADLVVFPSSSARPFELPIHDDPALVLVRGNVHLARADFAAHLDLGSPNGRIEGRPIWLAGDLQELQRRIAEQVKAETLEQNPVWRILARTVDSRPGDAATFQEVDGGESRLMEVCGREVIDPAGHGPGRVEQPRAEFRASPYLPIP